MGTTKLLQAQHYIGSDADKATITGNTGDRYTASDTGIEYYWNPLTAAWDVVEYTVDDWEKLITNKQLFYDDFLGAILSDLWSHSGSAGGLIYRLKGITGFASRIRIKTGGTTNDIYRLNWDGHGYFVPNDEKPKLKAKIYTALVTPANTYAIVGLYKDSGNYNAFRLDTAVNNNWWAVTRFASSETTTDTGISAGTRAVLKIDCVSNSEVNFYIDDVLKAPHTTNIAVTMYEPWFEIKTLENADHSLELDYVALISEKQNSP